MVAYATNKPVLTAAGDYRTTGQYRFCIQTNQTAVLCSSLGQRAIGVIGNNPNTGEAVDVITSASELPITPVFYGGTISVGDRLVPDANGAAINAALIGAGATQAGYPIAIALYAGVSGDRHAVHLLQPGGMNGGGIEYWIFGTSLIMPATADIMTAFTPGFAGRIVSLQFQCQIVGVGSGASITINAEIGTTNLTGGVITLNEAATTPAGEITAGSAITAANAFTASDTISLETVVTTAFTAGSGNIIVGYVRA